LVDHVRRPLEHTDGDRAVMTGALQVRTSLSLPAQERVDEVVASHLPAGEVGDVEAGVVALDPRTGEVLAIHGGREARLGDLNLATMTRRQNGSAFKPFVYAAALEEGISAPTTPWPAPATTTVEGCVGHDGGAFEVRGGPGGELALHDALVVSANTTFQLVGCELGGERIVETARAGPAAGRAGPGSAPGSRSSPPPPHLQEPTEGAHDRDQQGPDHHGRHEVPPPGDGGAGTDEDPEGHEERQRPQGPSLLLEPPLRDRGPRGAEDDEQDADQDR
jgi:hypothetical protein